MKIQNNIHFVLFIRCTRMFRLFGIVMLMLVSFMAQAEPKPIVIGLTPVFLDEQLSFLNRWQGYLERKTGRSVRFVQRQSYRDVTEMLLNGELDAAWLCGFPYVQHQDELEPLVVPVYQGESLYRSYLIVSKNDQTTTSLEDLRGRTFAFSDPDSNSGFLVVQAALRGQGSDFKSFFRRSFYTWSHRNVARAVAEGLADAGAVDGYVWQALSNIEPELTALTRVVQRSEKFGFPPFLIRRINSGSSQPLKEALMSMTSDPEGQILLLELNLDGFSVAKPGLYDSIAKLAEQL